MWDGVAQKWKFCESELPGLQQQPIVFVHSENIPIWLPKNSFGWGLLDISCDATAHYIQTYCREAHIVNISRIAANSSLAKPIRPPSSGPLQAELCRVVRCLWWLPCEFRSQMRSRFWLVLDQASRTVPRRHMIPTSRVVSKGAWKWPSDELQLFRHDNESPFRVLQDPQTPKSPSFLQCANMRELWNLPRVSRIFRVAWSDSACFFHSLGTLEARFQKPDLAHSWSCICPTLIGLLQCVPPFQACRLGSEGELPKEPQSTSLSVPYSVWQQASRNPPPPKWELTLNGDALVCALRKRCGSLQGRGIPHPKQFQEFSFPPTRSERRPLDDMEGNN